MIVGFWGTQTAKVEIPAVVHVDGSGRVQSVTREANPRFYQLIREFADRTGVPVVLNTSFNLKGDAIVCTPKEAIETFFTSGLDALFLGCFAIRKFADAAPQSHSKPEICFGS